MAAFELERAIKMSPGTPSTTLGPQPALGRAVSAPGNRTSGRSATERAADAPGSAIPVPAGVDRSASPGRLRTHAVIPADDALRSLVEAAGHPGSVPHEVVTDRDNPYASGPARHHLVDILA
ncbi:MAG: hypothetical protein ABIG68_11530 [Acidobacteriota bacterium]